jgi:hypothetical protein
MASITGFLQMGKQAAMDGGGVMVGRIASRLIPDQVGISSAISNGGLGSSSATIALAAAQIASGMLVAYAASRLIAGNTGNRLAAAIGAGAFDGVYEDILQGLSIPVVGQYLGDGASQLPMLTKATMGGYSISGYSKTRALPRVAGYSAVDGGAGQADAQRRRGMAGMAGGIIRSPY